VKKILGHLTGAGPVLLACVGLGSVTAGVYELVGTGWALVAGGVGAVLVAIDWRAAG
jgi:hypothetical protein